MIPLKYLSNFWGTLEILFINGEVSHTLTSSKKIFFKSMVLHIKSQHLQ